MCDCKTPVMLFIIIIGRGDASKDARDSKHTLDQKQTYLSAVQRDLDDSTGKFVHDRYECFTTIPLSNY